MSEKKKAVRLPNSGNIQQVERNMPGKVDQGQSIKDPRALSFGCVLQAIGSPGSLNWEYFNVGLHPF